MELSYVLGSEVLARGFPLGDGGMVADRTRQAEARVTEVRDHDFHPDEPTARQFVTPAAGVMCLDDSVLVTQGRYGGGVALRHYAFADRWVKINVTTDGAGRLTETPAGGGAPAFCFNCDIATPMPRRGADTFAVDLFDDVLVRADGITFVVTGEDEMRKAAEDGLISQREAAHAAAELELLTALISGGRLLEWLAAACPFGPAGAPPARPVKRVPVPALLLPGERATW